MAARKKTAAASPPCSGRWSAESALAAAAAFPAPRLPGGASSRYAIEGKKSGSYAPLPP
ncbi:MAG: hypothetical protein OXU61_12710 [Gammaproteobacteria bacterium]|nr:hypothetical protein [Gammaproteobacteria bacterium]